MCFTPVNTPLPNLHPALVATLWDTDTVEDLIEEERLRREEEEEMLRRDESDTENVS
jgi:hypothetical protein